MWTFDRVRFFLLQDFRFSLKTNINLNSLRCYILLQKFVDQFAEYILMSTWLMQMIIRNSIFCPHVTHFAGKSATLQVSWIYQVGEHVRWDKIESNINRISFKVDLNTIYHSGWFEFDDKIKECLSSLIGTNLVQNRWLAFHGEIT